MMRRPWLLALPGTGLAGLWHLGTLSLLVTSARSLSVDNESGTSTAEDWEFDLETCQASGGGSCSTAPKGARRAMLQISKAAVLETAVFHGEDHTQAVPTTTSTTPSRDASKTRPGTIAACRTTVHAAEIPPGTKCPHECPFWAEETGNHRCRFQCVRSSECGVLNANATVADQRGMYCRACIVPGCSKCNIGGGGDLCLECREGYTLSKEGACLSPYRWGWRALYAFFLLLLVFVIWWYVDLRLSEISNEAGLEQGLRFRSRTRLHKPKDPSEEDSSRVLWPLETNLLQQQVAGPGLALFFNFQLVVLLWALFMVLGWVVTSLAVSTDLLILGTKEVITPQQLCSVTTWGFKTQHALLWAKVTFMCVAYAVSFIGSISFAILQLRRFNCMDDEATMKDYAAILSKLPHCPGSDMEVENNLKAALQESTGEEIIGVSVCWSYEDQAEELMNIIESDAERKQRTRASFSMRKVFSNFGKQDSETSALARAQLLENDVEDQYGSRGGPLGLVRSGFDGLNACFGFRKLEDEDLPSRRSSFGSVDLDMIERRSRLDSGTKLQIVEDLKTTDKAFVIFKTEEGRDKAVEMSRRQRGLQISEGPDEEGHVSQLMRTCKLQEVTYEPDTVMWVNFDTSTRQTIYRLTIGVFFIILALVLWTLCFYLPYAIYVTSFSYARGERPTFMATLFFTLLVVAGNQTMYFVCRAVSEKARFRCQDTTEMTYLTLYFLACLVNFAMDMAVTSYTTYIMMVGMNARTSGGVPLEELSTLQIFESYPMQKALGHFFFWYAFPSCFLVPFICEPLFAIWLPGHIMQLLVRAHPNVVGMEAEKCLGYFCPMDLSRYSDILLNITMAVMAFLYPGSFVWKMFLVLFCSHLYIILMDHYRVLRAVPAFHFSTNASERCVQALTAIPVGLLAACTVFKYHSTLSPNLTKRSMDADPGRGVMMLAILAFTVHLVVHWSLLFWFVPMCARSHERSPVEYSDVSRKFPCSWFSANPVHCLRSRYLHEHTPPCNFYFLGKEHLLEANPDIGIYFEDEAAEVHEEDMSRQATRRYRSIADWMFGRTRSEMATDRDSLQSDSHSPVRALYSSQESKASDQTPHSERSSHLSVLRSPRSEPVRPAFRRKVTWHVEKSEAEEPDEEPVTTPKDESDGDAAGGSAAPAA